MSSAFSRSSSGVEGLANSSDVNPDASQVKDSKNTLTSQPGLASEMPITVEYTRVPTATGGDKLELKEYVGAGKLRNKVAIVTGGDSGIGRSVAAMFALEGANVVIVYLPKEQQDAEETKRLVEEAKQECLLLPLDLMVEENCKAVIDKTLEKFGKIDVLVNNHAWQDPGDITETSFSKLDAHFRCNVYPHFVLSGLAVPHMKPGSSIINTTSVTAYQGQPTLLEYSSTKGALVAFTRSLSKALISKGIRVNAVAPGPVITPLWMGSFDKQTLEKNLGSPPSIGHLPHPSEIGPSYVFLASGESTQFAGQVLHPNAGSIING